MKIKNLDCNPNIPLICHKTEKFQTTISIKGSVPSSQGCKYIVFLLTMYVPNKNPTPLNFHSQNFIVLNNRKFLVSQSNVRNGCFYELLLNGSCAPVFSSLYLFLFSKFYFFCNDSRYVFNFRFEIHCQEYIKQVVQNLCHDFITAQTKIRWKSFQGAPLIQCYVYE